jgi:hypothetical protein
MRIKCDCNRFSTQPPGILYNMFKQLLMPPVNAVEYTERDNRFYDTRIFITIMNKHDYPVTSAKLAKVIKLNQIMI